MLHFSLILFAFYFVGRWKKMGKDGGR